MNGWGKKILGVSLACNLGLVLFPGAVVFAQSQQGQQPLEPTSQSVDLPKQETNPEIPATSAATTSLNDYVIGPEDVLDVEVFNVPELTKTVRVANDGSISLALLGRVKAAGYTTTELRNELEKRWGETYLEQPQASVFVREFHARPVSVIGAVGNPGRYYLTGPRTLIEMLSMAGGLAKRGSDPPGRTVLVTRKQGFEDLQLTDGMRLAARDMLEINLHSLLYSHEDALNIAVKPFDTISVARADIVYVLGEVGKPGGFVLQDQEKLTVMQALALAGGVSGTAAKAHARILHISQDGSRTEVPVDLGKLLKGKSQQDVEMAANDILFVPRSSGKVAAQRALEAAIGTISGVLVYRSAM